jgi:hypothetical protein
MRAGSGRDVEIAANTGGDIGQRGRVLFTRAKKGHDVRFLRFGVRRHDRGCDLHLHATRLSRKNAADQTHIHTNYPCRPCGHASRTALTNSLSDRRQARSPDAANGARQCARRWRNPGFSPHSPKLPLYGWPLRPNPGPARRRGRVPDCANGGAHSRAPVGYIRATK